MAPSERDILAPAWHTGALIALIIAVAAVGAILRSRGAFAPAPIDGGSRATSVYLPLLIVEWSLTLYVCRIGRSSNALRQLLGKPWDSPRRTLVDVALALLAGILIEGLALMSRRLFGVEPNEAVATLLPATPIERIVWVLVGASVGFCEEVVYRGYLQTQLAAFTRSAGLGLLLQALLFGIAHGEQGIRASMLTAVYGLTLGILARVRASLLPGIICHISIDIAAGWMVG